MYETELYQKLIHISTQPNCGFNSKLYFKNV